MKILKNLAIFTGSLVCVCAPTALMIIGIWMIYNVGLWIGSVIGFIGCTGTLYVGCTTLEVIKSRKTK